MSTHVRTSSARGLAFLLAASIAIGALFVAAPPASAFPPALSVNPGQYTHPGLTRDPFVYVPTEVVTFIVSSNTAGEVYDVTVVVRSSGQVLQPYDDLTIPASLSVTLTYAIPTSLPDGDDYQIEVGDANWIESGRVTARFRLQRFAVQAYEVRVEVDRPAYIGGDDIIVTWSANNLKGGSLASDGSGQLWVYNTNGDSLITPSVVTYSQASGSFTFRLPDLADPAFDAIVFTWFNDSASNPIRHQQAFTSFAIDSLGVIVDVSPNQYPPGGIVTTNVRTVVTTNQANPSPFDPPEPGIRVVISVWEIPQVGSPIERSQYGASGLVTDAHGELTYVFQLDANIADGTTFEVRANASHANGIWKWDGRDTFTVSEAAGLSMVLEFNQAEYQAGDTANVTAIVSGAGGASLTYIFEVRDTTGSFCAPGVVTGNLLATSTQTQNRFGYAIGENFDGRLCFRVTADDGEGNRVSSVREFQVVFGWLLVNADRREYVPGDVITVTWELTSKRIEGAAATYFYEVRDENLNLVTSGEAGQSFTFTVPDPASRSYLFTVTATQEGRAISGSVSVSLLSGFFLTATFDRSSYAPGDTIVIRYAITARGTATLPSTFRMTFGLVAGPSRTVSTARASGDLTYVVPAGIDEGDQLFGVFESNTGSQTVEVLTIRGTNPAWFVTAGDIPVLVLIILVWLVVLTLLLWRGGALRAMRPRPEKPEAPAKPEPVHAPPTTPMTVTCRSCGSPIEITTSKRPIEVMCPKCGNTEMVA